MENKSLLEKIKIFWASLLEAFFGKPTPKKQAIKKTAMPKKPVIMPQASSANEDSKEDSGIIQDNASGDSKTDAEDTAEDSESGARRRIKEKFAEKKPKTIQEKIAEEEQKAQEAKNKQFADSDAAKKALETKIGGYQTSVKKKTKSALDPKPYLIRGKDNGRPAWHYVLVEPYKINLLKRQKKGSNINVEDFGKILKSGWGIDPPPEVKKEIEDQYE